VYQGAITLDAWNLTLYPTVDPVLMWNKEEVQINPHIRVFLLNKVYLPAWKNKIQSLPRDFQVAAETSFNTKNFYSVGDGYKWGEATTNGAYDYGRPPCDENWD
jgi:hypothetical protein